DLQLQRGEPIALDGFARQSDHFIERTVQPPDVGVVQPDARLRAAKEQVERGLRALRGEIPQRDIDRRERRRTDAAWRQRMDALSQAFDDLCDGPRVLPPKLPDQVI